MDQKLFPELPQGGGGGGIGSSLQTEGQALASQGSLDPLLWTPGPEATQVFTWQVVVTWSGHPSCSVPLLLPSSNPDFCLEPSAWLVPSQHSGLCSETCSGELPLGAPTHPRTALCQDCSVRQMVFIYLR